MEIEIDLLKSKEVDLGGEVKRTGKSLKDPSFIEEEERKPVKIENFFIYQGPFKKVRKECLMEFENLVDFTDKFRKKDTKLINYLKIIQIREKGHVDDQPFYAIDKDIDIIKKELNEDFDFLFEQGCDEENYKDFMFLRFKEEYYYTRAIRFLFNYCILYSKINENIHKILENGIDCILSTFPKTCHNSSKLRIHLHNVLKDKIKEDKFDVSMATSGVYTKEIPAELFSTQ